MAKVQSVEPNIADLANGWLRSYKLDYKLQQESLNTEIDQALNDYYSKNGGSGGNIPDAKLLLLGKDLVKYPVLIEYKGYKDRLVKLDADGKVANKTAKNLPDFKTINSYAVNGAVHYANAVLHYTSYTDVIAIGMTGYRDETGKLQYEIGVYYVSKSNFGVGQKVDDYTDLSFLKNENFDSFIEKVKQLQLKPKEVEKLRERREQEINASLVKLNNDIYQNEKGLSERDRVYLVAASIIATLGVPGKVAALEKAELKSSTEDGNRDGDIILRKIKAFLNEKNLPREKRELIVRTLQNTLTTDNINKVENGESQLKRVFTKIIDDLGIYYKIGLSTDFTGKLFNEMYSWLGFSQDKLNDVVLTPSYVATLLARLARVDMDSYVWDFATGSAGLLVAAMNEMLIDAKEKIKSPDVLAIKSAQIKANQLLGLEILSEVYMLAVLNMILMGDGSSNIINEDSDAFSFTKKEYTVIFAVNKAKMSKFIQYTDNLSFAEELPQRTEQHSEKSFLTIKNKQAFLVVTRNAFDQYRAAQNARDMISLNTAFYRLCDHDYKYDINSARCGVYDDTKFYRVAQRKSALSHAKMPPSRQIEEYLNAADNALDSLVKHSSNDFFALLSAARFHAQSLDSTTSSQNQLLDLWAIFESVLDISNAHTSERISQICRYLVPILKRKYIYSLFSQLANDIKNYSEDDYLRIIEASETETEIVQKICEFVLLDTNADVRTEFLNSCSEYPLLKERIEYYSRMLSKPADVYAFVEKHAERVKWQIMRIYRNRNLIIHNGDNMPYLELLIENLHSYVDDFMSYLIHCLSEGATVRRMCQELFSKECEWLAEFSNSRAGMTSEVICKMLAV